MTCAIRWLPVLTAFILLCPPPCLPAPVAARVDVREAPSTLRGPDSEAAARFLAAFRAGDAVAMEAIATAWDPDAFQVANEILREHAVLVVEKSAAPADHFAALAALAKAARGNKAYEALEALAAKWAASSTADLERELQLWKALAAMVEAHRAKAFERAEAAWKGAEADVLQAASSVTALKVRFERATTLLSTRRFDDAVGLYRGSAETAAKLGYPSGKALCLSQAANLDLRRRPRQALEAWIEELAVREALGDAKGAAKARGNVGVAHIHLNEYDKALEHLRPALAQKEALGDLLGAAQTRANIASVLYQRDDYKGARDILEPALAVFEAHGSRRDVATCLNQLGRIHDALEDPLKAREYFERSIAVSASLGDERGAAGVRRSLGDHYDRRGELDEAERFYREALAGYEAAGDREGAVVVQGNLGILEAKRGRYLKAREVFEANLKANEELGRAQGVAVTLGHLGSIANTLGQYDQALTYHQRALDKLTELKAASGVLDTLQNIANTYMATGRFGDALDTLEHVRAQRLARAERGEAAVALLAIGRLHLRIRAPVLAAECFNDAWKDLDELGLRLDAARALGYLAAAHVEGKRYDDALDAHKRALALHEEIGDRSGVGAALDGLGRASAGRGERREALEYLNKALAIYLELPAPLGVASDRLEIGLVHRDLGELDAARRHIEEAIAGYEAAGNAEGTASANGALATVLLRQGEPSSAFARARRAIETLLGRGRELGERQASEMRARVRSGANLALDAAQAILAGDPSRKSEVLRDALWALESARGLVLAEGIVNGKALVAARLPAETVEAWVVSQERLRARRERVVALLGASPQDRAALNSAVRDLDGARRELDDAIARMERASRRTVEVVEPRPRDLDSLRAALPEQSALVLYQASAERLFALVVAPAALELVDLGAAADIERDVQRYLKLAAVNGSDEAGLAAGLHAALIAPIEKHLGGAQRLLVSPDGPLHFLPFEALVRMDRGRRRRLVEEFEVVYVPSGTVYAALVEEARSATARGSDIVAVGDPVYPGERESAGPELAVAQAPGVRRDAALRDLGNLVRLGASADEALAVAAFFPEDRRTLLLRERATTTAFKRAVAQAPGEHRQLAAVHLACHGVLYPERPELSGLVLSGGEILGPADVFRLQIPADLTVLSACQSARGAQVHGEGVRGLVRAFFFAGCPRVVASNWKVGDASTRDFMVEFYKQRTREGLAPAAALRAAKLESLRTGGERAHPFHWAAFVLWGLAE